MSWRRVALVLLLLVLLQAAATEARARKNKGSRMRGHRRTHQQQQQQQQQQQHERVLPSKLYELSRHHVPGTAEVSQLPSPPPSASPQHGRRGQHTGRHRHHPGEGRHRQQQQEAEAEAEAEQVCSSCHQLEMRKIIRLEQIKDRVLTATGLITPPNMTGVVLSSNPDVQDIIKDMQLAVPVPSEEPMYDTDEPEVKTKMFFFQVEPGNTYQPQPAPANLRIPDSTNVLYFKLNNTILENRARRAILQVWLKPLNASTHGADRLMPESHPTASVSVYKVTRPKTPGGYIVKKAVTTVMESYKPHEGNWVKIGVYSLMQEWLANPEDNLGVVVEALEPSGKEVAVTDPLENPSHAPLLVIHTEDGHRSRARRNSAAMVCNGKNGAAMNESRCCRYPLNVDFVELGWDFIVAPKNYEANFCNGECPFLYAQKYAHTTVVQKLPDMDAKHGPCCGARKLSPMKMLYYDHNHQIKLDIIQDMVVEKCGCS